MAKYTYQNRTDVVCYGRDCFCPWWKCWRCDYEYIKLNTNKVCRNLIQSVVLMPQIIMIVITNGLTGLIRDLIKFMELGLLQNAKSLTGVVTLTLIR